MKFRFAGFYAACVIMVMTLSGCGGGDMLLQSAVDPSLEVRADFREGVYGHQTKNHAEFMLIEGRPENPTQVLHIRYFWEPRAGVTQVDTESINSEISYLIFADGEVGIYGGGGLVFPGFFEDLGDQGFSATIEGVKLRLIEKSPGFEDRLGASMLSGGFTAKLDQRQLLSNRAKLNLLLNEILERPIFIQGEDQWREFLAKATDGRVSYTQP